MTDEYAPGVVFTPEQIERLRELGCGDPLLETLAYHVGRQREELVEASPEEEQKRAAAKIALHSAALEAAIREAPPEIQRMLSNALYFGLEEHGHHHPTLRDSTLFRYMLEWVADAADSASTTEAALGRPGRKGEVLTSGGVRVEAFSVNLVAALGMRGFHVSSKPNGPTAKILELCRNAAGLDPASGETLVRHYLRPAIKSNRR